MTSNKTTDVESTASGTGSSSNIIQNGSLIANVIMFAIIVILLWRGDDAQVNRRFDEADRHHTQEIQELRVELNQFEARRKEHDNRVQQWEDYTYTHVTKLDAQGAAHGWNIPPHISTPP